MLDGQQRLQSLYIGLCESYEGRELYLDILSGEVAAPDDIKYKFRFMDEQLCGLSMVEVQGPRVRAQQPGHARSARGAQCRTAVDRSRARKIAVHFGLVFKAFHADDGIGYQELDSTENIDLYSEEDVVEIFIRANSGGTRLGKSDLLFSLLASSWEKADENMEDLLADLNRHGFAFTRDFVLKTCLTLLDQGARYEVDNFRKNQVREDIETKWAQITASILDVLDFVRGSTFIQCDRAIPSYSLSSRSFTRGINTSCNGARRAMSTPSYFGHHLPAPSAELLTNSLTTA